MSDVALLRKAQKVYPSAEELLRTVLQQQLLIERAAAAAAEEMPQHNEESMATKASLAARLRPLARPASRPGRTLPASRQRGRLVWPPVLVQYSSVLGRGRRLVSPRVAVCPCVLTPHVSFDAALCASACVGADRAVSRRAH